jgi:hypothetical protein
VPGIEYWNVSDRERAMTNQVEQDSQTSGSRKERRQGGCELCGRGVKLTFHHLIPRKVHRRGRFQKRHAKAEMRLHGLFLCSLCHSGIHDLIPNEVELAESYNTRELLLAHEGIARHVAWAAKQKS